MSEGVLLDLWSQSLWVLVWAGGPFLAASLLTGIMTSLLQAATQLQDNILSFAPKLVAVGLVLAVGGRWVLAQLVGHLIEIARILESMGHGG